MGYSGTTYGGADMTTILVVMIVIIAVAVLIWLAVRKKDDGDVHEEPEEDSWILSEAEKKKGIEKEEEKRTESEEESREIGKKKATELSYGRGMTKKKTERTKEKKWESVIVYSYSARRDIWRCIYCDGENPVSEEYCQVCGKKRQRQK